MSWQQLIHWLPWVYFQMEPSIYHHIPPFAGYVRVGLATAPDLLMKSTWTSLFSADISITLPANYFLAYSSRMYWPGFGNTMSGVNSTIYIPILSTCLCLCLVIYCPLTVPTAPPQHPPPPPPPPHTHTHTHTHPHPLGHKYMVWCCTWYGLYTLKNLLSCPSLRRSTASFSTYKNLTTAILFKIGPVIVIVIKWSHDMSFRCCVQRRGWGWGWGQLLHSTTNGITQNLSIWSNKNAVQLKYMIA